jgi:hypothetical protein
MRHGKAHDGRVKRAKLLRILGVDDRTGLHDPLPFGHCVVNEPICLLTGVLQTGGSFAKSG